MDFNNLADAEKRRHELVSEYQDLQAQLGNRNLQKNGRRADGREYWTWRAQAQKDMTALIEQIRDVKGWIKNYHISVRKATASHVGECEEMRKKARLEFNNLCDQMQLLETQCKELLLENQALREKLGRIELEKNSSPLNDTPVGARHDVWRDETT